MGQLADLEEKVRRQGDQISDLQRAVEKLQGKKGKKSDAPAVPLSTDADQTGGSGVGKLEE